MNEFVSLLQQGNAWFFIPSAILLGALHGLEPGHSKTMMAAFIVAIRGTVTQAVLLGLSATISHTAVVWLISLVGLYFAHQLNAETVEPYFQTASAVMIMGIALWMMVRTWFDVKKAKAASMHSHHDHEHDHEHGHEHGHEGLALEMEGYQDAHERAHALEIKHRFKNQHVTNKQIIFFGLTGGLVPCPASITVLLLCLQLKKFVLGMSLVLCFSIGLAITMVASGVFAAVGMKHVQKRWSGFDQFTRKAPFFSALIILCVGLWVGYQGLHAILH